MQKDSYTIRTMTRPEVDIAIRMAAAEGWNPGLHDADCFYAADPAGFLVGLLGDEPIATISAVRYGASFAFIGLYIVKPEHRGRGYGLGIWNAALATLPGRTIGLDGVVARQENYRKSGFALAYRNIRYQGTAGGYAPAAAGIVPLSGRPFLEICEYDRPFFPDDRKRFLECWISQPRGAALGVLESGRLAGYGVLRACRTGYKIGPLFADTPELADRLFTALQAEAPAGAPIFLDVPEVNRAAVDLANRHRLGVVFETARMYRGAVPDLPQDRIFGVTTFELG
ncbi:MAG: GNAT family N-acetyltransferase [Deltaproteobacteria bacterium]|nr:GNAT family N-acetyltransferase [Deltaproteobacteria bacterium]